MSADPHSIFVSTACRRSGSNCQPGFELISKLRDSLKLAVPVVGEELEVSGIARMASCSRPRAIAFRANDKATYLFGDIDPEEDIDDLVAFARQYRELGDGWCSSVQRPGMLKRSAQAHIPAAMIVTEANQAAVS
ncbi:MAG: DUF1636 family protein [Pseudomonadota bacterium]